MRLLLGTTDVDLLRATTFALESRGLAVVPMVPKREIAVQVTERDADIVVLDVGFSQTETGRIVKRIKDDQRLAGTVLILFSSSHARLKEACPDRGVLNKADEVVVETFDESDLIGTVESAARRLRIERTQHQKKLSQWMDLYAEAYPEERRKNERLKLDVPVTIRGKDVLGEPFEEETMMLNVSAGGACLKTENHLENNSGLEISVPDPHVADSIFNMRGTVVRTDHGEDRLEAKRRRLAVRFADDVRQDMEFHLLLARFSGRVDKGSE
jgi:DNA-binding response OmpR family regulator